MMFNVVLVNRIRPEHRIDLPGRTIWPGQRCAVSRETAGNDGPGIKPVSRETSIEGGSINRLVPRETANQSGQVRFVSRGTEVENSADHFMFHVKRVVMTIPEQTLFHVKQRISEWHSQPMD
jgi:hypothetical protein